MKFRLSLLFALAVMMANALPAQVLQVADLNTGQIHALKRDRTVVLLSGGMLEEHGPYLPAFTDGILSARLTREVAAGIVRRKPGWTVLVFPPISVGSSGSNEIGRQYSFPGTYTVRPSTLRAAFADMASELGDTRRRRLCRVRTTTRRLLLPDARAGPATLVRRNSLPRRSANESGRPSPRRR